MLTVQELRDLLVSAIEDLEDYDSDAEVVTTTNTYFLKHARNILETRGGYLDLSNIEVICDEEDDDFDEDTY